MMGSHMKDITRVTEVSPLAAARQAKGLSREGLAFKANVSFKTVERLEKGETPTPRRATAQVIADALGVAPTDIWPELEMAA
jgi:transcriptional regulator with XRE-family HTH domain